MKFVSLLALLLIALPLAAKQDNGESGLLLGTGRIIAPTTALCVANTATATANCTAAAASAFGELMIVISKTASVSSSATAALTFTGTAPCTSKIQAITPASTFQSNGSGHFVVSVYACLVNTATTIHPVITWTGGSGSFTDISLLTYSANFTWNSATADKTVVSLNNTASTSCATGTTAATVGSNDLVLAFCENFNAGQTWGTTTGYTNRTANERNTLGWYDKVVTTTGTQSATIPLSASDVSVGMIVAYKSN
jgi:hypothetical protein